MAETKTVNLRDLPEDLVRKAKACAALHGMTLKDFIVRLIAEAVQRDIPARPMTATFASSPKPDTDKKRESKRQSR